MLKRYFARRDNPWELLALAGMILVPGIILLLTHQPMLALQQSYREGQTRAAVLSPAGAHMFGAFAILAAALLIGLYVWIRRAITRGHVVEHGHEQI
jgi:hypothetical protein